MIFGDTWSVVAPFAADFFFTFAALVVESCINMYPAYSASSSIISYSVATVGENVIPSP